MQFLRTSMFFRITRKGRCLVVPGDGITWLSVFSSPHVTPLARPHRQDRKVLSHANNTYASFLLDEMLVGSDSYQPPTTASRLQRIMRVNIESDVALVGWSSSGGDSFRLGGAVLTMELSTQYSEYFFPPRCCRNKERGQAADHIGVERSP